MSTELAEVHADRYRMKWGNGEDELIERFTPDQPDLPCTYNNDGTPALPWTNGYGYITDWHGDDECEAHKPTYTHHAVPDGETFELPRPFIPKETPT